MNIPEVEAWSQKKRHYLYDRKAWRAGHPEMSCRQISELASHPAAA